MAGANSLRTATVRLILGIGQIASSVAALVLLVNSGISPLSLGAVVVACLLTSTSVFLFGRRGPA
jgi:hypothetical protein